MTWIEELGKQIRDAREKSGLSQVQLAKSLSVSRPQLSNYENGKSPANFNVVAEIAEALNTEFVVGGCVIKKRDPLLDKKLTPKQLCLEFDVDHVFESTDLRIRPSSSGSVTIIAKVRRVK
jgi:transcriptional regulator with XRE-family HTH domain